MTGSPEEFEDRIRRVLHEAGGQLPVRRTGWEGPSPQRRPSLPRPGLGGIATAVGVAVVAAVVVIALGALKHSPASPAAGAKSAPKPTGPVRFNHGFPACGHGRAIARPERLAPVAGAPSKALLAYMGVLRRPLQRSDQLSQSVLRFLPGAYLGHARLAQRVAGTSYYVVPTGGVRVPKISQHCLDQIRAAVRNGSGTPVAAPDPALIAKARALKSVIARSPTHGGLCVLALGSHGAISGNCVNAPPAIAYLAFGAGSSGRGSYGLARDGVAKVALYYAHATVTTPVVGNVYVFRPPQGGALPRKIVWLDANGKAIPTPQGSAATGGMAYGFTTSSASGPSTAGTYNSSPVKAP
jgi:hypothetical protein